jgi:catechol 2,3-dioxygenase-like lactoylglutathione lyase family enzyme
MSSDRAAVESINAITLASTDMAASVDFYEKLGFEVHHQGPGTFTSFKVGPGHLNLCSVDDAPAGFWGRVIFYVADVDELYGRAVAAGFVPESAPTDASWGERYFHLRDPDGHELSFARPLPEA